MKLKYNKHNTSHNSHCHQFISCPIIHNPSCMLQRPRLLPSQRMSFTSFQFSYHVICSDYSDYIFVQSFQVVLYVSFALLFSYLIHISTPSSSSPSLVLVSHVLAFSFACVCCLFAGCVCVCVCALLTRWLGKPLCGHSSFTLRMSWDDSHSVSVFECLCRFECLLILSTLSCVCVLGCGGGLLVHESALLIPTRSKHE